MTKILILLALIVMLLACNSNTEPVQTVQRGNGVAISLNPSTGKEMVFNFRTGKSYSYECCKSIPDTSDFHVSVSTDANGKYIFTNMIDFNKGSKFADYSSKYIDSSIASTHKYFESIQSVPVGAVWKDESIKLLKGTILLVKTKENKYAKVLISDIMTIEVPVKESTVPYSVSIVNFDYVYQSNGSIFFE